jgi:hypothetical protein
MPTWETWAEDPGGRIEFDEWGERELKGVPGTWRLFSAVG